MYAVRTIRLCTKDCLCLYVCPTGATDTENGQVDASKCIGCGACVKACPSHALSLAPEEFPPQQKKAQDVADSLRALAGSKTEQEQLARRLSETADSPVLRQLAAAVARSNRLMAEDLLREAGYMLPQSANTHALLLALAAQDGADFPREAVERLLELLPVNEPAE